MTHHLQEVDTGNNEVVYYTGDGLVARCKLSSLLKMLFEQANPTVAYEDLIPVIAMTHFKLMSVNSFATLINEKATTLFPKCLEALQVMGHPGSLTSFTIGNEWKSLCTAPHQPFSNGKTKMRSSSGGGSSSGADEDDGSLFSPSGEESESRMERKGSTLGKSSSFTHTPLAPQVGAAPAVQSVDEMRVLLCNSLWRRAFMKYLVSRGRRDNLLLWETLQRFRAGVDTHVEQFEAVLASYILDNAPCEVSLPKEVRAEYNRLLSSGQEVVFHIKFFDSAEEGLLAQMLKLNMPGFLKSGEYSEVAAACSVWDDLIPVFKAVVSSSRGMPAVAVFYGEADALLLRSAKLMKRLAQCKQDGHHLLKLFLDHAKKNDNCAVTLASLMPCVREPSSQPAFNASYRCVAYELFRPFSAQWTEFMNSPAFSKWLKHATLEPDVWKTIARFTDHRGSPSRRRATTSNGGASPSGDTKEEQRGVSFDLMDPIDSGEATPSSAPSDMSLSDFLHTLESFENEDVPAPAPLDPDVGGNMRMRASQPVFVDMPTTPHLSKKTTTLNISTPGLLRRTTLTMKRTHIPAFPPALLDSVSDVVILMERIMMMLDIWLRSFKADFCNRFSLLSEVFKTLDTLESMCTNAVSLCNCHCCKGKWVDWIVALRKCANTINQHRLEHGPDAVLATPVPLASIFMEETLDHVALGLSLVMMRMFIAFSPRQYLLYVNGQEEGTAAGEFVSAFNQLASFVTHTILGGEDVDRPYLLNRLISLAQVLHTLGNHMGCLSIITALQGSSILRLRFTWASIDTATRRQFLQLDALYTPVSNFAKLRSEMRHLHMCRFSIPALPVWQRDLFTIEEVQKLYVSERERSREDLSMSRSMCEDRSEQSSADDDKEDVKELLNVVKLRRTSEILMKIATCQQQCFDYRSSEERSLDSRAVELAGQIYAGLRALPVNIDEGECHALSRQVEPPIPGTIEPVGFAALQESLRKAVDMDKQLRSAVKSINKTRHRMLKLCEENSKEQTKDFTFCLSLSMYKMRNHLSECQALLDDLQDWNDSHMSTVLDSSKGPPIPPLTNITKRALSRTNSHSSVSSTHQKAGSRGSSIRAWSK